MNAIDPEEMAGDYVDYRQHAEPSIEQKHADLEARVGDVIRQMQAAGNQYWAGVLADALTNKEKS